MFSATSAKKRRAEFLSQLQHVVHRDERLLVAAAALRNPNVPPTAVFEHRPVVVGRVALRVDVDVARIVGGRQNVDRLFVVRPRADLERRNPGIAAEFVAAAYGVDRRLDPDDLPIGCHDRLNVRIEINLQAFGY